MSDRKPGNQQNPDGVTLPRTDVTHAFPFHAAIQTASGTTYITHAGMTLRDYFAGQLMAARYANASAATNGHDDEARRAYRHADALLKAREEP